MKVPQVSKYQIWTCAKWICLVALPIAFFVLADQVRPHVIQLGQFPSGAEATQAAVQAMLTELHRYRYTPSVTVYWKGPHDHSGQERNVERLKYDRRHHRLVYVVFHDTREGRCLRIRWPHANVDTIKQLQQLKTFPGTVGEPAPAPLPAGHDEPVYISTVQNGVWNKHLKSDLQ